MCSCCGTTSPAIRGIKSGPTSAAATAPRPTGPGRWQRNEFDNTIRQTAQRFLGGMCSASFAPEGGTAAGEAFRAECRALFDRHAVRGLLTTHITTVCYTGTLP